MFNWTLTLFRVFGQPDMNDGTVDHDYTRIMSALKDKDDNDEVEDSSLIQSIITVQEASKVLGIDIFKVAKRYHHLRAEYPKSKPGMQPARAAAARSDTPSPVASTASPAAASDASGSSADSGKSIAERRAELRGDDKTPPTLDQEALKKIADSKNDWHKYRK